MLLESISVESAISFYKIALAAVLINDQSQDVMDKQSDFLIKNKHIEYIEREEYFGEMPDLLNLVNVSLPEECLAHEVIHEFMSNIPEEKWDSFSDDEQNYIRYDLPFYQRLNYCLLPYKTRVVNINFGQENDYLISVPIETEKEWGVWSSALKQGKVKLTFYPPLNGDEVLQELAYNLGAQ